MPKPILKTDFNSAFKALRNRFRRFHQESCIQMAIDSLNRKFESRPDELKEMPWQQLLLLKWICQEKTVGIDSRPRISAHDYLQLRQELHDFPETIDLGTRDTLPAKLFLRQLLYQQIGFQRRFSKGFCREAALLAMQPNNSTLRALFKSKTAMEVEDFLDISFATYAAIVTDERSLPLTWYDPLRIHYTSHVVDSFISAVSLDKKELVRFFGDLPDCAKNHRVASEFYEFPVIKRYPFLKSEHDLRCWHPMIFYRGMEGFVHSVLSEAGASYIHHFSKLFEKHVVGEAVKLSTPIMLESEIASALPPGSNVPDALISFPECNIFIEAKAGLFDESVMVVGHSEIFALKTKTIQKALQQGMSASVGLRSTSRMSPQVIQAPIDYLLIITNKELGAGRGTALAEMYPESGGSKFELNSGQHLPLSNVYVLSIEDYERLMTAAQRGSIYLPDFLKRCVKDDDDAKTSVFYFDQHLDGQKVPLGYSELVNQTIDACEARLSVALSTPEK